MNRHLTPRAINRARWLAELSAALDDGERILSQLIAEGVAPAETQRLRRRLIELHARLVRPNCASPSESRIVGSTWPSRVNCDHSLV